MKYNSVPTSKAILVFLFLLQSFFCGAQAPATCTAAIGTPANGTAHYINITWAAVASATAYNLEYSTNGSTWTPLYTGTALTYSHNTGAIGNLPYYYHVRATVGGTPGAYTNASQYPIYSACDAPATPTLSNAQPFTMQLAIAPEAPDTNPAYTTYSIYCTTTSQYVQAGGTLGATEVFQTRAAWGTVTISGLSASTNYCFYAKAKNMDGDVRMGSGAAISTTQQFNSNVLVTGSTASTTVWFAPNSHTPFAYYATGGCTGGMIKYSGSFTSFWGNFVRTPEQNCTGNTSVVLNFDLSNSYIASHIVTNRSNCDGMRFYMWVDNGYKNCSSIKIGGVEVGGVADANGLHLIFDQLRTCTNVSVTFDLTTSSNLSNILFYLEATNPYNDNQVYSVVIDNVTLQSNAAATACLSTTACTTATIQTNPSNRSICQGANTTFGISTTGGVSAYQWQVSTNGGGSWANATGGVYSNDNTATLSITGATAGMSGYQYRCNVTGACAGNPVSNVATLTVNALPDTATNIISAAGATVCQGQTGVVYSVGSVAGATGYTWSLPSGASITNGANTATITVSYAANASAGNIIVTPTNTCGNGTASPAFAVAVNQVPGTPGAISGNTSVCSGSNEVYSVAAVAGATSYTWSLPNNWSGTSSSESISTTTGGAGTIFVTANNTCGSSAAQSLPISVGQGPAMPAAISGADTLCDGSSALYSIATVPGATSYTWTLPSGWQGTSSTASINVNGIADGGSITVTANNACGSSAAQTLAVALLPAPATPGTISGADTACSFAITTYSVAPVAGATGYNWQGPVQWSGNDSATTYTVYPNGNSQVISVAAINSCGTSAYSSKTVYVYQVTDVTFALPQNTYCQNAAVVTLSGGTPVGGTYSGPAVSNNSFDPSLLAAPANYILQYDYTDGFGCQNHDTAAVRVEVCSGITNLTANALAVYPNPFSNQVSIILTLEGNTTAELYDITGRKVISTVVNQTPFTWKVPNLTGGVYTLRILQNGNLLGAQKLVKAD
jgi:hypothetical protein